MATPDRWPPWIEPPATMAAATQDITVASGVAWTDVISKTITPHVKARARVGADVRVVVTVNPAPPNADILFLRITLDGTPIADATWGSDPVYAGGNAGTRSFSFEAVAELAKETTHTLKLQAATLLGTGTFRLHRVGASGGNSYSTALYLSAVPALHSP